MILVKWNQLQKPRIIKDKQNHQSLSLFLKSLLDKTPRYSILPFL